MGIDELTCRGRQEAWKWLERSGLAGRGGMPSVHGSSLDRFLDRAPGRFFEGALSDETLALLVEHWRGAPEAASVAADAILQGRFDLLGHRALFFGDPVDWHLDPISGRRAPRVHWSRLDPLDPSAVGDSKVIWELNRHQWLLQLGRAHRLTGDERYAAGCVRYVREWMRANPPGVGINWASSLEVALRLISWCWALFLLKRSAALSPDLFVQVVGGIEAHASHVERYLSRYFSPNTHLTGEALGLFYAGVVFPELGRAEGWRELGRRILIEQSERQILPDGVYFEHSTCYQRYTAEIYLHFMILAERNGVAVPDGVRERIRRLLDFLLAIRRPDGSVPQIGDGDAGCLLPLTPRSSDDFRGLFSTAAAVFGRSEYAWAAGGCAPETVWLLGAPGLRAFEGLRPAPPAPAPSRVFACGGYTVMGSGWDQEAHHLIFDAGPLGCAVSGGHGHADLLSIQCSVFGEPYLVDPGTYCYTPDPDWRDFFRSTAAHSTVLLDGSGQAVPAGPFAWETRPRARLLRWTSTDVFDLAEGEHDAYRRLPDPVVHRRRVVFVKPRYWVVVDDLDGAEEHRAELRFQFAPMPVTVDATGWARARGSGGRGLLIRPFATAALKGEVREGDAAPVQGWVSPDYGERYPAPVLIYSTVTRFPLRIVTLLLPTENPSASPPAVSPLAGEGAWPAGIGFADGRESVRFEGPEGVTVHPPGQVDAR
jgi:hypothetical protein